jgi:hypothetical protein
MGHGAAKVHQCASGLRVSWIPGACS